jgi:ATP-dependent DNA helicase RecQ
MTSADRLLDALREYWGYNEFRPLQQEAMQAALEGRDSVVVLPTGGGKSLCYQVPAVVMDGLAVIVSPLISLMKDQVDALRECGIAAAAINSTLSPSEKGDIATSIRAGELKLLYVAPERLCNERMLDFLATVPLSMIAIDEAHCISAWGHDFRPEFRMLGTLRARFPGVGMHAYTATATEAVREDIASQLHQRDPLTLVGNFDRPNLNYFVERKTDLHGQIREVLERRKGESGIIYAFSRKEVDSLAAELRAEGYRVAPYHAGLSDNERQRHQDAFVKDKVDIVVATVAFGMGIDKPDVRFVLHTHAPQSIEHYQQETGRAGRDGLPSECRMFYGAGDFVTWTRMKKDLSSEARLQFNTNLRAMESYCQSPACRHRALVEYFGQEYESTHCGACDACLDEVDSHPDSLILAQKVLSCVARVRERFGADYVAQVLIGSKEKRIVENSHHELSTWGLLKEHEKPVIRGWIEQLLGQGFLLAEGEYRVIKLTETGRALLKGEGQPRLAAVEQKAGANRKSKSRDKESSFAGVDMPLFERLRVLRREIADERGIPPFTVFSDVTLRDLARVRPDSAATFRTITGIGDFKTTKYGPAFLGVITAHCTEHSLATNQAASSPSSSGAGASTGASAGPRAAPKAPAIQATADAHFAANRSVEEVARLLSRAPSTVQGYLATYLETSGATSPIPWVDRATFARVTETARDLPLDRLAPIYQALDGAVGYDELRLCIACLRNARAAS